MALKHIFDFMSGWNHWDLSLEPDIQLWP